MTNKGFTGENMKSIDEMIENVRATMEVEGMELPPLAESLGRRMLNGEITRAEGIEIIKEKYNLKENTDESLNFRYDNGVIKY